MLQHRQQASLSYVLSLPLHTEVMLWAALYSCEGAYEQVSANSFV
jgi:hypothetical protein